MNCSNIIELEILEDETNMDLNVEFQGDIIRLSGGGDFIETDPTVPDWAKQPEKPKYTAEEIGTLTAEQIESAINQIKLTPGPKGDTGEQGPRGEQGLAGDNGQDGLTPTINEEGNWQIGDIDTGVKAVGSDGKSAYEIAKENGFEGAETEWLESLKGIIDLNYNPESENAQSGKAVAEAIKTNYGAKIIEFTAGRMIKDYPYEYDKQYAFYFTGSSRYGIINGEEEFKNGYDALCIGHVRFDWIAYPETYNPILKFINLDTLNYGQIDFSDADYPDTPVYTKLASLKPDSELNTESENPIQNKVITEAINNINSQLDGLETLLASI